MPDTNDDLKAKFESIKLTSPYGAEYWSARELAPLLGYDLWRRFADAIDRAKSACQNVGQDANDHFANAVKKAKLGAGHEREMEDFALSRFGCYLVAMNGDPRKPEIAAAQAYFVVQTRRAEQWDELREELDERARLRQHLAETNKQFNATAQEYGVNSRSFGRLHDAGARGLYGDMGVQQVKEYKGIGAKEDLADRMGRAELIANDFVRSQTEQKIRNEEILGQERVIAAHFEVGRETRNTIERIGGTRPEDLPPEPSIRPLLETRTRRKKKLPTPDAPSLFDVSADTTPEE
ncbi:MAG TPA: DNA damage-inducible protein D [Ktedonobacterales bacterium]